MKILIIANHLLDGKIASGGDRIFVEMAKRWGQYGAQMTLMAPKVASEVVAAEVGVEERIVVPGSRFDKLQQGAIWAIFPLYIYRTFKVFGLLTPHLFSSKKGAGYTTGDFFCNVLPAFYLKNKLGTKWIANIYHINESPFVRKGNSFLASTVSYILQRFSFLFVKRGADVIFLNNSNVKNDLVKMGFSPEKLFVTGLGGIDLKKLKMSASGDSSNLENRRLKNFAGVFLGRLNPTKGIFDLPKIWKKVVERIPNAKLVIIGGGEKWLVELKAQIQGLELSKNIKIAGFVSEEEKQKLLSQSKVFVFPSYEEGWGIAVAEAMAIRLPVVAYDLPSYKEVFPGAMVTNEVGNIDAMAKSILKLLQNENEYRLWQEKGYNVVQRYDYEKIAKQQWEIINQ